MLAVLLALCASVSWGVADFGGGVLSRRLPAVAVVFGLELAGLAAVGLFLLIEAPQFPDSGSIVAGAVAGLAGTAGLTCFFAAMALGSMAVTAPVFAAGAATIPVGVGIATGDEISVLVGLGIALALIGIVLASLERHEHDDARRASRAAIGLAVLGAFGAAGFAIASDAAADGGVAWGLFVARAAAVPFLAVGTAVLLGRSGQRPVRRDLGLVGTFGLADLTATACYGVALTEGSLAVVAVLGALYPVITVGLARLFLQERVRAVQLAGVAAALLGVALVAAG